MIIIIVIIIIIIKISNSKQEKQSYLQIAFATPQAPAPWKAEENTTQGSNQWLTAPFNPSSVPVTNTVQERSFHIRTWAGRKNLAKLGHSTHWYFNLQWMRCCRSSRMSNSSRSSWKLDEQTVIRVRINLVEHTKPSNTTSMTQRQETLINAKPGHQILLELKKLKMTFSSWTHHSRTMLNDWENKCKIATKLHRGVHKYTFHQPQNSNSLRDKGNNTTHMAR